MSLLRREPGPVYRVYAEDEYAGDTESVGAEATEDGHVRDTESFGVEAAEGEYTGDTDSFRAEAHAGPHRPAHTAGSLELRRRPLAFGVVGLLVLLVAVVVVLVLSNASRPAPHRSVPAAPAVTTATAGHPLAVAAPLRQKSTPTPPLHRSQQERRPSATRSARTEGDAPASALAPVPAPVERPLPGTPAAPVTAEFGFER